MRSLGWRRAPHESNGPRRRPRLGWAVGVRVASTCEAAGSWLCRARRTSLLEMTAVSAKQPLRGAAPDDCWWAVAKVGSASVEVVDEADLPRLGWAPADRPARFGLGHLRSDATARADACSVARATAMRACRTCAARATGKRFSGVPLGVAERKSPRRAERRCCLSSDAAAWSRLLDLDRRAACEHSGRVLSSAERGSADLAPRRLEFLIDP